MKTCPTCNRTFDDSFSFCLEDGAILSQPWATNETETLILPKEHKKEDLIQSKNSLLKYVFWILIPIIVIGSLVALFRSVSLSNKGIAQQYMTPLTNIPPSSNAKNLAENKIKQNADLGLNTSSSNNENPKPAKRKDKPNFSDYPATEFSNGRNAPVILSTSQDRMYKTMLREASIERPDFAGHYVLAWIGCGTECAQIAVIDTSNGKVFWFPETINPSMCNEENLAPESYRIDSKLLIFCKLRNDDFENGYLQYYVFENNRFNLVHSIKTRRTSY